MWISWRMRLWTCEFSQKCDFEKVNSVKIEILEMWFIVKKEIWENGKSAILNFVKIVYKNLERWKNCALGDDDSEGKGFGEGGDVSERHDTGQAIVT